VNGITQLLLNLFIDVKAAYGLKGSGLLSPERADAFPGGLALFSTIEI
jgi:hypothetical protein